MPRPLSATVMAVPLLCRVTVIASAWSFKYSSTELSTISHTRWCRPFPSTLPIYIDGRLRTASRPSSTVIESAAVYFEAAAGAGILGPQVPISIGFRAGVLLRRQDLSDIKIRSERVEIGHTFQY